ncbi:MAG: hypothetical protein SCARUB_05155 [Candidatus Scalindua rubra]|uniref:Uncharacterized protein n=1 Tax=Candidatus Scalindua rubra TaxID=1872076 RepID=A0A1E3X245_9BACT|nr:MAG: hypothetical protein SCARUB_05155 [Candidatus Scalindua rubra]
MKSTQLAKLLQHKDWTPKEWSDRSGLSIKHTYNILSGEKDYELQPKTLQKIRAALLHSGDIDIVEKIDEIQNNSLHYIEIIHEDERMKLYTFCEAHYKLDKDHNKLYEAVRANNGRLIWHEVKQ